MAFRSLVALVVACSGCVTTLNPGDTLTDRHPVEESTSRFEREAEEAARLPPPPPGSALVSAAFLNELGSQVEFEHGCPPSRVRLIRQFSGAAMAAYDLDVCGVVRRYENAGRYRWLDVTSLFPVASLPAPLPPIRSDAAPSPSSSQTTMGPSASSLGPSRRE